MNNRVSVALSPKQIKDMKSYLDAFTGAMPFLVGLTDEERVGLMKMRRNNKLFVEDCLLVAKDSPHLLTEYITEEEMRKDYDLYQILDEFEHLLLVMYQKVRDTRILAGSEAIVCALMFYKMCKIGEAAGVPGAAAGVKRMAKRFEGMGRSIEQIVIDDGTSSDEESDSGSNTPTDSNPDGKAA